MALLTSPWTFATTLPASGGGAVTPIPTPAATVKTALAPNFAAGPTGKDETRPWSDAVVDGVPWFANGWDQPWRWNESGTAYDIGSVAPSTFAPSTTVATNNWLANGVTADYYFVFAVSSLGKETAPQLTGAAYGVSITNSAGAGRAVLITWTDPGGEFDQARIYRRMAGSGNYRLVATVTASTATYTDDTADVNVSATPYVWTYRTTLPPIFKAVASFQNRAWGWTGEDSTAYYGQQARADSRDVTQDFPAENILPIGMNDDSGPIVSMREHFGVLYAKKRHGVYAIDGTDAATFGVTRIYSERGTISHRTAVETDGFVIDVDERGVYLWSPGGEPIVAGSAPGAKDSPLSPLWDRLNLSAGDTFHAINDRTKGLYVLFVALDFEPVANYPILYDYRNNRFLTDPTFYSSAAGYLLDAYGVPHRCRVDDLGLLWEDDFGSSDGVLAGTAGAPLTAGTALLWTCGAASFDTTFASGVLGSAIERYASTGALVDQNRCFAVTGTTLTPLYFDTDSTPAAGQTCKVGVIPAVFQLGKLGFGTSRMKHATCLTIEHDVEPATTTMLIEHATDDDAFATLESVDLSTGDGRMIVGGLSARGWFWTPRGQLRDAGVDCAIRALEIDVNYLGTQR